MKFEKIHNKGQARLFKNKYLEFFTKTHPLVIWGMYLPLIIFLLYYSNAVKSLGMLSVFLSFFAGILFWTFFEYIMHRFVFHLIAESERLQKVVYVMHGNHHEYPRDKERLFMPPLPSLILASVIFGTMFLMATLIGVTVFVFSFFAGFMLGYLMYGTMHYAIHAWNPPFKWMKPLWRNHHLHHYKQQERGFGVSSTLWDRVFGTMFDLKTEKEDKEKVKELMFDGEKVAH
ncbi:MAG TPA: sterol desaturase family protein [Ferruginibacter sp.]|nr:sterol desaturase family protein [Ferruginibacter sp.]HMP20623.1 sterol desaturase family protein [Ferruginibacter sp.]